jgi:uroporphyrinogen decarboxylase
MRVNMEFSVAWGNAQVAAGATAICYFDPVSSPTVIPRELFLQTGFPIARQMLSRLAAPCAIHLASGRALPIADELGRTGAALLGVSAEEDLAALKAACRGRLALLGNLNGVVMRRWSPADAEAAVKDAVQKGGPGGGFILGDNHGEIPLQCNEDVLMAITDAARTWGRYPLRCDG